MSRRRVLAAGAAGAAGAITAGAIAAGVGGGTLLAGCDSGGCERWSDRYEPASRAGAPSGGDRRVLATLAEIPVGRAVTARGPDGEPIVVARPTETTAVAFSARCTHHGCLVNPDGARLRCPPHDGWFDATTGAPTGGPPKRHLRRVPVDVVDGDVVVA